MSTEQKNSYLEAHMEMQQHIHQVSMQLNKTTLTPNHSASNNQSMVNNHSHSATHQSTAPMNSSNPYLNPNVIKVSLNCTKCFRSKSFQLNRVIE